MDIGGRFVSRLVLMGSGETSPSMVRTHRESTLAAATDKVTVIDTPFGFQENAEQLTDRISDFFGGRLGLSVNVATLRGREPSAVDTAKFLADIRSARMVFSGPGSPTYALDVWESVGVAESMLEVIREGGVVTLASAAAVTAGTFTIPVYEIYKVGLDTGLRPGLDLTGALGLPAMVVPHWNNAEGGNHDTSRCFIGRRRFADLKSSVDVGVIGIDEHTAGVFDFAVGRLSVSGLGSVTIEGSHRRVLEAGESADLAEVARWLAAPDWSSQSLEPTTTPGDREVRHALDEKRVDEVINALLALEEEAAVHPDRRTDLRVGLVELAQAAERGLLDPRQLVGDYVALLLELRASARSQRRFEDADRIRDGLSGLGVEVRDTDGGVEWDLKDL